MGKGGCGGLKRVGEMVQVVLWCLEWMGKIFKWESCSLPFKIQDVLRSFEKFREF